MKNSLNLLAFLCAGLVATAQVGIGTDNPTATLDVNGTVRVTQLEETATNLVTPTGRSASRSLNRTKIGAGLLVIENGLDTAPVSTTIGSLNLGAAPNIAGNIQNLDLGIGAGSANSNAIFIKMHSYTTGVNIAGIKDGIDGRHVTLFFSETTNASILEDSPLADPQNRILTAATSQLSISGMGFIDVVYDATAGADGLGRWIVIKFRG